MNTDNIFIIGKDHSVCEDFSLSGVKNDIAYVIVCDGCSSSKDVDFGSRLIALSARESIIKNNDYSHELFGLSVIAKAEHSYLQFPSLDKGTLDCTLLVAWVKNNELTAYIYGDGMFFHKSGNNLRYVHIDYSQNGPSYLSYQLDDDRLKSYKDWSQKKYVVDTIDGDDEPRILDPFAPIIIKSPVNSGDVIVLSSDGINSFRNPDSTYIPYTELINEFIGFKTTEGEFVVRRISAFLRKCKKENINHFDDLGVAAIVV